MHSGRFIWIGVIRLDAMQVQDGVSPVVCSEQVGSGSSLYSFSKELLLSNRCHYVIALPCFRLCLISGLEYVSIWS